ncbi:HD-GYP domain-containing protein [Mangrovibacillus cuniculi]|uniref:HD-GYP domain-containing protein n=1 Tax=Mangrovibacillus cuniculi TaxID=2593652 RepID=UPI00308437B3
MKDIYKKFVTSLFIQYIFGSLVAVFGVGSMFIFHSLDLQKQDILTLLFIMMFSGCVMAGAELALFSKHIKPIRKMLLGTNPSVQDCQLAYEQLHRFPTLTVIRIMGPHLFGLSIPAITLSYLAISYGYLELPLVYIGLACTGAILIAMLHGLIEFFLTISATRPVLLAVEKYSLQEFNIYQSKREQYFLSLKKKLVVSSLFLATFPIMLFSLANQVRLIETGVTENMREYWEWALVIIVVVGSIALLGAMLLFKHMLSPIDELAVGVEAVREGNLLLLDNPYSDEFSKLIRGYNHMVNAIDTRDEDNRLLLESFFTVIAATLDARDPYTAGHSVRVANYSVKIANAVGWTEREQELLKKSALLHDIGKIGIRDEVLLKEGKLTDEEFRIIQEHPSIGEYILKQVRFTEDLSAILPGVRSHHERFDGKGYPDRLQGEDIPVFGRVMAVADAYDAMTSDRPYRKGMPKEKALSIIREGSGTQWDPLFARVFLDIMSSDEETKVTEE